MTTEYQKPLPEITEETKEYWEGCKRHELRMQRCKECGTYVWYPQPMCHNCNSMNLEWTRVSGKGMVYSYTIIHHPTGRAWESEVPYAVVLVELPEGVRMVSNLVDCRQEDVKIGMPVEVVFDDVTQEITLPKFRPA